MVSLWLTLSSIPKLQHTNYLDLLLLSLWKSSTFDTDTNLAFNKKVTDLVHQRQKNDLEHAFWKIQTTLSKDQTDLEIPLYFFESDIGRLDVQPFDPRFTLAFYYYYMRVHAPNSPNGVQAPFHWADWMDMTVLDEFIFAENKTSCDFLDQRETEEVEAKKHNKPSKKEALDPAEFCVIDAELPFQHNDGNRLRMGFNVKNYPGRMTPEMAMIAGRSYMYTHAPPPASIIFMTDNGSYNMTTGVKQKLLHNGIVEDYLRHGKTTINTVEQFKLLNKKVPSFTDRVISDYQVNLEHKDFVLAPLQIIKDFQDLSVSRPLTRMEMNYLSSVKTSVANQNSPPKYFQEARIFNTVIGDHYDWRFFGGVKINTEEQELTLHRMVRTWLSFCRKQGITTWMAHGSLLSWYWNGIGFPWDNDIDVQMPLLDLHKLGRYFNQSLVVEDGKDGFGRYFIDCTSSITVRDHSNGKNNIDARFIDVDSGLYIDITALAVSGDATPERYLEGMPGEVKKESNKYNVNDQLQTYNCRNKHFLSLAEISPLIKSFVEGKVAYIPKRYSDILTAEYNKKGLLDKFFSRRLFMPQLRLWLHQDDLRFFLRAREQWNRYYGAKSSEALVGLTKPNIQGDLSTKEVTTLLELGEKDLMDLLLNDEILMSYAVLRDMTAFHESEIMRLLFGKSTQPLVIKAKEFPPLKYEPFLHRELLEYITYEGEVDRYIKLNEKHVVNAKDHKERSPDGTEEKLKKITTGDKNSEPDSKPKDTSGESKENNPSKPEEKAETKAETKAEVKSEDDSKKSDAEAQKNAEQEKANEKPKETPKDEPKEEVLT